jgi:hypothetical protein
MSAPTPSDARVFWLDVGQHARLFRGLFALMFVPTMLAMGLVQFITWQSSQDTTFPQSPVVCAITFVVLAGGLTMLIGAMLLWMFGKYRLLLGPDWVAIDSNGAFRQQVNRADVEHVSEVSMGLVLVRRRGSLFRIPRSLNGYETVRNELVSWGPPSSRPWIGMLGKILILVGIVILIGLTSLLMVVINVLTTIFVHLT